MINIFQSKADLPSEIDYINKCLAIENKKHLAYGAYYHDDQGNFGDRIIPKLGIDLLEHHSNLPLNYRVGLVRNKKAPDSTFYNVSNLSQLQGVIIGPGGLITGRHVTKLNNKLFLNFNSNQSKKLKDEGIPLFFWTTGVNFWSNKNPFTDEVKKEISIILEHTTYAFLRGNEDIAFIKSFTPESLHHKLIFQPCASFFLEQLRGVKQKKSQNGRKRIAINIAYDHLEEFYHISEKDLKNWKSSKKYHHKDFANKFKKNLSLMKDLKLDPVFFCATKEDTQFIQKYFSNYPRIDTHRIGTSILKPEELFAHFDFCVGMRLHSWLPFLGLNIPSLFITPFKIRAGMPKDFDLPNLALQYTESTYEILESKIQELVTKQQSFEHKIKEVKEKLFKQSANNSKLLLDSLIS